MSVPLLVVGSAPGWRDEYLAGLIIYPGAHVMALNSAGERIPSDYWASVHADVQGMVPDGYTGAFLHPGNMCGVEMGYERIVLCGCPLEGRENAIDGSEGVYDCPAIRRAWTGNEYLFRDGLSSFSGWTRERYGRP